MKIVAFLTQYSIVDRIIDRLKSTFVAEKPPPKGAFQDLPMVADPPFEYFT